MWNHSWLCDGGRQKNLMLPLGLGEYLFGGYDGRWWSPFVIIQQSFPWNILGDS